MRKTFDYLYTVKAEDSIEIEDIGNCFLKVYNDLGYSWYLSIETQLGESRVKIFGPLREDLPNEFKNGFNFNFSSSEYKESRLSHVIDNFINDPKKMISQVFVIEKEEFDKCISSVNLKEMR